MPSASARNVRAGGVFVEFMGKDGKLQETVKRVGQTLRNVGSAIAISGVKIAGAGSAVLAPMAAAVGVFVSAGSAIDDASQRTGIAAEQLSTLAYAAKQSDTDMQSLVRGVNKLQQKLTDAVGGNEAARKSFSDLGVSVESLASMSPDEQFRTMAEAISQIQDPAERTSAAMDVFGKAGVELLPMLASGKAGLKDMEDRARELGLQMSGESVQNAAKLGDNFDDLTEQGKMMAYEVGASLAPALISATESIKTIAKAGIVWLRENRGVVMSVAAVGAGLVVAGSAIAVVGSAIAGLGVASGVFSAALGTILSPVGIVVGAIAGIAYWSGAGGEALGWLREQFGPLLGTFSETVSAISSAMSAGNWEAAGNAAWAGLKLAWVQGSQAIQNLWREWSTAIVDTFKGTVDVITSVWANTIGFVESKLAKAQNKTASWIISAQASLGLMSEEEAKAAQDELVSMGQEAQDRIKNDVDAKNQAIFDNAEKRQKAADEAKSNALADAERELAEAKAAADAAIQEALTAKPDTGPGSIIDRTRGVAADTEGGGGGVVAQYKSVGTATGGTFAAIASRMFAGVNGDNSLQGQQLKASKAIATNTEEMKKTIERALAWGG